MTQPHAQKTASAEAINREPEVLSPQLPAIRTARKKAKRAKRTSGRQSWRDILPIHPAAELFPRLSEVELRELGEDIWNNGLRSPVMLWRKDASSELQLLDGICRLDAMETLGIPIVENGDLNADFVLWEILYGEETNGQPAVDPYEFVVSANILRRHLTTEVKRTVVANVLKAKPEASNRQVARQTKVDDKTVARVRRELEGRAEIPHVATHTDTKGRKQQATKPRWADVEVEDEADDNELVSRIVDSVQKVFADVRNDIERLIESEASPSLRETVADALRGHANIVLRYANELCEPEKRPLAASKRTMKPTKAIAKVK